MVQDCFWNIAINGNMVLSDDDRAEVPNGSEVTLLPIIAGGEGHDRQNLSYLQG